MNIGRNDLCHCGSGKKYKKCHLELDNSFASDDFAPSVGIPGFNDLDPEKADVVSPEYWEKMSKRLPAKMRKELKPIIKKVRLHAEMASRREEIDTAMQVLEKYKSKFKKLAKKPDEFLRRAEELFAEDRFIDMRFNRQDVQRAFQTVGYPNLIGAMDGKFFAKVSDAVRFLVDDDMIDDLCSRLLFMLPDYVKAERYIDGLIIEHSASLMIDEPESGICPFLLEMFMYGMDEWDDWREAEQNAMLKEVGISPEEIRRTGLAGMETWCHDVKDDPEKCIAMEKFLVDHPEMRIITEAQCRTTDEAVVALMQRKELSSLLLTDEEVGSWLVILFERISDAPEGFTSILAAKQSPDPSVIDALAKLVYDVASEMAGVVFTPERLKSFKIQLHELLDKFTDVDDKDGVAGIHGLLVDIQSGVAPQESHGLSLLCYHSLREAMHG